ncbi:collagen triple helix repeat protein, partial [Ostertagia ostertagi]
GEEGSPGSPGRLGEPGREGYPGQPGIPGESGKPGKVGEPGAPGREGIRGAKGPMGDKGEPGPQGQKGPAGYPGRDGQRGSDGKRGRTSRTGCPQFSLGMARGELDSGYYRGATLDNLDRMQTTVNAQNASLGVNRYADKPKTTVAPPAPPVGYDTPPAAVHGRLYDKPMFG